MWESAPAFGALLVFAEHRYYGMSKPYKKTLRQHMQFLTSEQAMADYAELVLELKAELKAENSAVIGFGGSYGMFEILCLVTQQIFRCDLGCPMMLHHLSLISCDLCANGHVVTGGMLGTWMRIKYPHILDGVIAGSAPIWSYLGEDPPYDSGSYAKIVTADASEEGGSAPACSSNVRKVRHLMLFALAKWLDFVQTWVCALQSSGPALADLFLIEIS